MFTNKIIILLFSLSLCLGGFTNQLQAEEGIQFFKGNWKEALKEAKNKKKPIFVDAYAVWCGPCKYMDQYIFTDSEVAAYFNETFINYKLDVDEEVEISEGFGIEAMPTYLFVDAEGKVFYRKTSAMEADVFLKLAKSAMQMPSLRAKYEKGERSKEFIVEYLTAMGENADKETKTIADDYFKSLKEVALLEPQNFELMVIYPRKYDSREFKYYVKNIDKFMEQYPNEAELIAFNSIDLLYQEAIETQSEEKMNELSMLLTQLPNVIEDDKASQMSSMAYMSFYETTQEWDKYAPNAVQYFEKYGRDEFESFLRAAFNFYNFVEKPEDLTKMLTWLEESVVSEENYANLYLNAALLKKLDRKKEALELAKKSLAVAQLEEVNAEIIQQLITELEE
jgi:thioredoxin-related protein